MPVGGTVIINLSRTVNPGTVKEKIFPIAPISTTGGEFSWYEITDPVAPFIVTQVNVTADEVETPQFIVAFNTGFTIIAKVVLEAHCPTVGAKVYVVVAILFKAGDHDPFMPFSEVFGKGDNVAPEHIGATALKVGTTDRLTVIVIVAVDAHCPTVGEKGYVVVAILFKAEKGSR